MFDTEAADGTLKHLSCSSTFRPEHRRFLELQLIENLHTGSVPQTLLRKEELGLTFCRSDRRRVVRDEAPENRAGTV